MELSDLISYLTNRISKDNYLNRDLEESYKMVTFSWFDHENLIHVFL